MALPIVSGSEVSTPASTVPLDAAPLRQAALAPGRLAAAIGQDVGGLFQDVSQKIQANRNARTVFDADLAMRKQKDQFTANLAKMPDETQWLPAWQDQVENLRSQVMAGPNVNPLTKRILSQKFDIWQAATTSEIRTAALLKGTKETRETAIADATYAAHQGDLEGANNIMRAAVDHYAMSAADAKKLAIHFPSIAAQAQADTAISTNPIKAPELIQQFQGTIEPRVYVGILARATAAKNRAQAQNANDFAEQMDESPDGTIDPKILARAVKDGLITDKAAQGLRNRMAKKEAQDSKEDFDLAMMDVDDHRWADDKTPEETARKLKDENIDLPTAFRRRLYNHINAQMEAAKKQGQAAERPIERNVFEWMRADPLNIESQRIKQLNLRRLEPVLDAKGEPTEKKSMQYVYSDKQIEQRYGKGATRDDIVRKAQVTRAAKFDKMRDFFSAHAHDHGGSGPTEKEAIEHWQYLNRPEVEETVNDAIDAALRQ